MGNIASLKQYQWLSALSEELVSATKGVHRSMVEDYHLRSSGSLAQTQAWSDTNVQSDVPFDHLGTRSPDLSFSSNVR